MPAAEHAVHYQDQSFVGRRRTAAASCQDRAVRVQFDLGPEHAVKHVVMPAPGTECRSAHHALAGETGSLQGARLFRQDARMLMVMSAAS